MRRFSMSSLSVQLEYCSGDAVVYLPAERCRGQETCGAARVRTCNGFGGTPDRTDHHSNAPPSDHDNTALGTVRPSLAPLSGVTRRRTVSIGQPDDGVKAIAESRHHSRSSTLRQSGQRQSDAGVVCFVGVAQGVGSGQVRLGGSTICEVDPCRVPLGERENGDERRERVVS